MPIRHVLLPNPEPEYSAPEAVYRALSLNGDLWIGNGCFAAVYEHPLYADKVIKIVRYRDRAYTAYVRAILRLQDKGKPCPWLPRIYEATMFHVYDPSFKPNPRRFSYTVLAVVLDKLVGDTVGKLTDGQREVISSLYAKRIYDMDTIAERFSYLAPCGYAKRQLKRAQRAIKWAARKAGSCCDLHWGNVMFKPDTGQLVFTDPIA